MLKEPQTETRALWKERYRVSGIWWAQIAPRDPSRGLAVSSRSGTPQLYAWAVGTGELRPLTHRRDGVFSGLLAPDGSYVYYLLDEQGSETGHYTRIPWEGGAEQDIT